MLGMRSINFILPDPTGNKTIIPDGWLKFSFCKAAERPDNDYAKFVPKRAII